MSALLDQLAQQSRLLTAEEKATLARILIEELDPSKPTVVYCGGGYRSSVAASVLRQRGFRDVSDILGGYAAWESATS